MRFLCISPGLPGQLDPIAAGLAARHSVCMASLQRRAGFHLPQVSSLVIKRAGPPGENIKSAYARMWCRALKVRENALATYRTLTESGFKPDVVLFQAGSGIGLNIREVFHKARFAAYADPAPDPDGADLQTLQFAEADCRFCRFESEIAALPKALQGATRLLPLFVNTALFRPGPKPGNALLFFIDSLEEADLQQIWRLALGLILRGCAAAFVTRCRRELLCRWRDRLEQKIRERIGIHANLSADALAALGKSARLAAFPKPDRKNFTDLLAMMSCGLPVLAEPRFAFLRPGANMLPWPEGSPEAQLAAILALYRQPPIELRKVARDSVLAAHDQQKLLPGHLDFLCQPEWG